VSEMFAWIPRMILKASAQGLRSPVRSDQGARCEPALGTTEGTPCDRANAATACGTNKTVFPTAFRASFRRFLTRVRRLANSC
jgi:hypothetical protein